MIFMFAVSLEQLLLAKDYVDMLLRRVKERNPILKGAFKLRQTLKEIY